MLVFKAFSRERLLARTVLTVTPMMPPPPRDPAVTKAGLSVHEAILDQLPAGVVVVDPSGRVSYANVAAGALLGWDRATCVGQAAGGLFGDRTAQQILSGGHGDPERRLVASVVRRDERSFQAGFSVLTMPSEGEVRDTVVVFRDLDELFTRESLVRREGQAALGRIVAGLAHELRNPLAAIAGLASICTAESSPDDPHFEAACRIGELVARMSRLITACVEVGDPPPAQVESTAATHLVRDAVSGMAPLWTGFGAAPLLLLPEASPRVDVDPGQIVRCLQAVIENACEAAGHPNRVEVRVESRARTVGGSAQVRIEVRDEGPGIPPGLVRRVFEPFYTTKESGVGLGLAAARALVVGNGGSIDVHSQSGATTFTLSLPASREDAS